MKLAAVAVLLLLLGADPQQPARSSANLAMFRALKVVALQEGCCGGFHHGLPPGLDWRLQRARKRLIACYGEAAVQAESEEASSAYEEFLGTYDPAARRRTYDELLAEQQDSYARYSAQLAELERNLKRSC